MHVCVDTEKEGESEREREREEGGTHTRQWSKSSNICIVIISDQKQIFKILARLYIRENSDSVKDLTLCWLMRPFMLAICRMMSQ